MNIRVVKSAAQCGTWPQNGYTHVGRIDQRDIVSVEVDPVLVGKTLTTLTGNMHRDIEKIFAKQMLLQMPPAARSLFQRGLKWHTTIAVVRLERCEYDRDLLCALELECRRANSSGMKIKPGSTAEMIALMLANPELVQGAAIFAPFPFLSPKDDMKYYVAAERKSSKRERAIRICLEKVRVLKTGSALDFGAENGFVVHIK